MVDDALWRKTDHVCRHCFGRIYSRPAFDAGTVVQCSHCGREAIGTHEALCACNNVHTKTTTKSDKKRADVGHSDGRKYEALVCVRNPNPTPEFPGEIVAGETPRAPKIKGAK